MARMADDHDPARRASARRSRAQTGKLIVLALEPEPCCLLETTDEAIALLRGSSFRRARRSSLDAEPDAAVSAGEARAGTAGGISGSASMCATPPSSSRIRVDSFARIDARRHQHRQDPAQLGHQGSGRRVPTGSAALARSTTASICTRPSSRAMARSRAMPICPRHSPRLRRGEAGGEWRVHCHVPVFLERSRACSSTQRRAEGRAGALPRARV